MIGWMIPAVIWITQRHEYYISFGAGSGPDRGVDWPVDGRRLIVHLFRNIASLLIVPATVV